MENIESVQDALLEIQSALHAPKGQTNSFGGYKYRSCEDILTAVKPLLKESLCTLLITDSIEQIGDRYYVKATVTLTWGGEAMSATAYAREPESRKGCDESQITGAASSYARKYALNGLFAIDDTKDADTMDNRQAEAPPERKAAAATVRASSPKQRSEIEALIAEIGVTPEQQTKALAQRGVVAVKALSYDQAEEMLSRLREKRQQLQTA